MYDVTCREEDQNSCGQGPARLPAIGPARERHLLRKSALVKRLTKGRRDRIPEFAATNVSDRVDETTFALPSRPA